ncbi:polysaccharide deacetylase family protein [Patulibacter minatonensis]|uniref:polysaccharide deacetylase family protein n=1 Tax=Patulibacter minatonensis TaxID=298163 RepID=UPI0012FC8B3E|nr:polysaccharide deacetylase family protein [Patulibacter minatonensis]
MRVWCTTTVLVAIGAAGLAVPAAGSAAAQRSTPSPAATVTDGRDPGPVDVRTTSLVQDGQDLTWDLGTRGPWESARLQGGAGRRICLSVSRHGREAHRACVVRRGSALTLRSTGIGADGLPTGWHATDATVSREDGRSLRVRGLPKDLVGRATGPVRWYATTGWEGSTNCPEGRPCADRAPATGSQGYVVRRAVQAGCVASGPTLVTRGPARKEVALTFDDGPWTLTSQFLDTLKRLDVPATFFMIGQQVGAKADLLRRMVREGHALGNHTWSHATVAGGGMGQITSANDAIERAVGFRPCLFRPPGGARGGTLDGQLSSLGMIDVLWTVDTNDWKLPGTAAVASRAGGAPAGGIVLMHDGGGPRGGTLAAIPSIVKHLRARGMKLVTVPELLGLKPRWQYR